MPEICRFFGVIIRMYAEAGEQHHRPHLHAYYHGDVVICAIDAIEIVAGSLPLKQRRLVEAWAELHQDELLENWSRLQDGHPARRIEPLR